MALEHSDEAILAAVGRFESRYSALHARFATDFDLYRLVPYATEGDYASYTSNGPRTFADRVIAFITFAELILRIPNVEAAPGVRGVNEAKERLLRGMLRAADRRLTHRLAPPLRDQLAWHSVVRGWVAGRAMLFKPDEQTAEVDITPWDPRYVSWELGPDGLDWVVHKITRARGDLEREFRIEIPAPDGALSESSPVSVYDYYDREVNMVVAHGMVLKRPTPHGAPMLPAVVVPVGPMPFIRTEEGDYESVEEFGESVYKPVRQTNDHLNEMLSIMLELAQRSRKPPLKVFSPDGSKTLEEDPYLSGQTMSLQTGLEDIAPAELMRTAPDFAPFLGLLAGEYQRGSLPYSIFGELQFQLSGFAINSLRAGVESVLRHRLEAVRLFYEQALEVLSAQFATGAFPNLRLRGRASDGSLFEETFEPDVAALGGNAEVELVAQLPEDDASKYAQAQIAREGPTPLMPDYFIRDQILKVRNADDMEAAVLEQQAGRALPIAQMYEMMRGALVRGRPDLAQLYGMAITQGISGAGGAPNGTGVNPGPVPGAGPPTFAPQIAPNASVGLPPPAPTPQAGPNVPPGSPRPGALSDEERLARLGLVRGG